MDHNNNIVPSELIDRMFKDQKVRREICKQSFFHFFHTHFAHYVIYKTAPFQKEIMSLIESGNENLFIVAFRGSGKSTIVTTAYSIWAILGKQKKKFVVIMCQTQAQAKLHMTNLRRELESNELLKKDLGPFKEESNEWGSTSLVFSNSSARITVASTEQSIRGIRHNQYRPDLIICDDVEDLTSTKTREGRNKTHQWLTGEVIPAGDKNTRLIIIGNLLHEDSLLMRIKDAVESKNIDGIFKEYPLIKEGKILWTGKYNSMADIENEKRKAGNENAWQREYLLNIIPSEDQVVHRDWLHYYEGDPEKNIELKHGNAVFGSIRIGIDLAISNESYSDYTAMVPVMIFGYGNDMKIYVLPKIINRKINFPETVDLCKALNESYFHKGLYPTLVIEDVAYQKALPQHLESLGIHNVRSSKPKGSDKRSRLAMTTGLIKEGKILFPKEGCEDLANQLVNFGVETKDDLADAFSIVILDIIENPPRLIGFF